MNFDLNKPRARITCNNCENAKMFIQIQENNIWLICSKCGVMSTITSESVKNATISIEKSIKEAEEKEEFSYG